MHFFVLFFLSTTLSFADPTLYESGKKLYFAKGCNGCHGINADGSNQYPPLAHRRKAFLVTKLNGYRAKQASNQLSQMMIPFALGLSDREIDALTTFFSEYKETKRRTTTPFSISGDGGS